MIDVTVTAIGGEAIRAALERAPEAIRSRMVAFLNEQGEIAAERARALAPYNPNRKAVKSGYGDERRNAPHLRDSIRYFAWGNKEKSELTVRAVGGLRGAPHAHMIEFGVRPQKIRVYRRVYASKLMWLKDANRWRFKRANRVKNRKTFMYTRTHHVRAHPFFEPAIKSLGDLGAKLQAEIDSVAMELSGEGGGGNLLAGWDK